MKIYLAVLITFGLFSSCASLNQRVPANNPEIVNAGEWCPGAATHYEADRLFEVKMQEMALEVGSNNDKSRASKSCTFIVPVNVPLSQSLKIRNFVVGHKVEIDGQVDSWQYKRSLVKLGTVVLGGVVSSHPPNRGTYPFAESSMGKTEFGCGEKLVLRLEVGHAIASHRETGNLKVKEAIYKVEMEVSPCTIK